MKKLLLSALICCSINSGASAYGILFTQETQPVAATSSEIDLSDMKMGDNTSVTILNLFTLGDAGINKIARENYIKEINYVDKETTSFLMLFQIDRTKVYGK